MGEGARPRGRERRQPTTTAALRPIGRTCALNAGREPQSSCSEAAVLKEGTMETASSSAQNSISSCVSAQPCVAPLHPVAPLEGPAVAASRGGTETSPIRTLQPAQARSSTARRCVTQAGLRWRFQ